MHLTIPELGALMLVLFATFYWLGKFARLRAILAFLGTVAIGTSGFVGRILAAIGGWLASVGGSVTAWAFGTTVAGVFFVVAAIVFIHDLHPKGGGASKRTGLIGLLLGASLASGVAFIPALAPVVSGIHSLLGGIVTFLNSL